MAVRLHLLLIVAASSLISSHGYHLTGHAMKRPYATSSIKNRRAFTLNAKSDDAGDGDTSKLSNLGFSDQEIQRSRSGGEKEQLKVKVNLIPDVDAATLTAVGFSLIAFNFFVLGNLGDGGIAGIVATIINTLNQ